VSYGRPIRRRTDAVKPVPPELSPVAEVSV